MSCETLKHLRHLSSPGDYFISLDLADGYYTLCIREEDRDFFTVNYWGELRRLACFPMGWSGFAYYLCNLSQTFTNYLRRPATPPTVRTATPRIPSRRFLRNIRWRGIRLLPYMDDFMFMAHSREASLLLRDRVEELLHRLGLQRNPKKGGRAYGNPDMWVTTSASQSTSRTANFEPPSTNCIPSPNRLQHYSAARRVPPAGYPPHS
jgi:hypothetical protein